jgi:hypothetical protein
MMVGVLTGIYFGVSDFNNLVTKDLGLPPNLIGLVIAFSSLVAIGFSLVAGWLRRIPLLKFLLLDMFASAGTLLFVGLTRNLYVMIIGTVISFVFLRLRMIIYQHHLLDIYPNVHNKATLLSTLSFFGDLNEAWIPIVFGLTIVRMGYYKAYTVLAAVLLVVITLVSIIAVRLLYATAKSSELPLADESSR